MDRPEILGEAFNFSNELQITVLELVQKDLDVNGQILSGAGNSEPS